MAWIVGIASIVAVLQGAAWLGGRGALRPIPGAVLTTAGLSGLGWAVLHGWAPGFFG